MPRTRAGLDCGFRTSRQAYEDFNQAGCLYEDQTCCWIVLDEASRPASLKRAPYPNYIEFLNGEGAQGQELASQRTNFRMFAQLDFGGPVSMCETWKQCKAEATHTATTKQRLRRTHMTPTCNLGFVYFSNRLWQWGYFTTVLSNNCYTLCFLSSSTWALKCCASQMGAPVFMKLQSSGWNRVYSISKHTRCQRGCSGNSMKTELLSNFFSFVLKGIRQLQYLIKGSLTRQDHTTEMTSNFTVCFNFFQETRPGFWRHSVSGAQECEAWKPRPSGPPARWVAFHWVLRTLQLHKHYGSFSLAVVLGLQSPDGTLGFSLFAVQTSRLPRLFFTAGK